MRLLVYLLPVLLSCLSWANVPYPTHPVLSVTPGSLCENADEFRYPEKIPYCKRNVSTHTKKAIIDMYEAEFGYKIWENDRANFKIDHFIPLCMGGSNNVDNLWPQHKSVFIITDPAEHELCRMLAAGEITQVEAISEIRATKFSLR